MAPTGDFHFVFTSVFTQVRCPSSQGMHLSLYSVWGISGGFDRDFTGGSRPLSKDRVQNCILAQNTEERTTDKEGMISVA